MGFRQSHVLDICLRKREPGCTGCGVVVGAHVEREVGRAILSLNSSSSWYSPTIRLVSALGGGNAKIRRVTVKLRHFKISQRREPNMEVKSQSRTS